MSCMKKRILALLLVAVMFVLSACSSGGNDVSRAYNDAMNAMKQGKYAEAADKLSGISYYEDSVQLAQYCRAHAKAAEGLYGEAVDLLRKLDGYRDSSGPGRRKTLLPHPPNAHMPLPCMLMIRSPVSGIHRSGRRRSGLRCTRKA